jgi:hypothetical protein
MTADVQTHLARRVQGAHIRRPPYPHIYVENVFPASFYDQIQQNIPDPAAMRPLAEVRPVKGYDERFILDPRGEMEGVTESQREFWRGVTDLLRTGGFRQTMLQKFQPFLKDRFKGKSISVSDEVFLVQDITKYALGPHTDAANKVITVLFYLPVDRSLERHGTSIYQPKDPAFACPGGPHYPFDGFDRVKTMPFVPNSMFAFVKGDKSFHGVEPVTDPNVRRWLLLYDIKLAA